MSSVYISELDNISKQSQSIRNCFIDSAKMLRPTVHLILLILFYFALFDGIEACKSGPDERSSRKSGADERSSLSWHIELFGDDDDDDVFELLDADVDVNNIGWDPLERCEIELIEPSGRTTRFE